MFVPWKKNWFFGSVILRVARARGSSRVGSTELRFAGVVLLEIDARVTSWVG